MDFTYSDADGLADGGQIDVTRLERAKLGGVPEFSGQPVTRITDTLILALIRDCLRSMRDTAAEDETPKGWLWESAVVIGGEKVWLHVNDHGWTLMAASDY